MIVLIVNIYLLIGAVIFAITMQGSRVKDMQRRLGRILVFVLAFVMLVFLWPMMLLVNSNKQTKNNE
jgi:cytochrome bd-type quinol oxidase subunit 2